MGCLLMANISNVYAHNCSGFVLMGRPLTASRELVSLTMATEINCCPDVLFAGEKRYNEAVMRQALHVSGQIDSSLLVNLHLSTNT